MNWFVNKTFFFVEANFKALNAFFKLKNKV
jgi:hypothetical protein